jgi:hypothetical protein
MPHGASSASPGFTGLKVRFSCLLIYRARRRAPQDYEVPVCSPCAIVWRLVRRFTMFRLQTSEKQQDLGRQGLPENREARAHLTHVFLLGVGAMAAGVEQAVAAVISAVLTLAKFNIHSLACRRDQQAHEQK